MKENISTIPINEIFEKERGCPVCRIRSMLEIQYVDFIVGDAMMEPSVRVEVNAEGFCERHYKKMLERGSRLPIALMLQTHLEYIEETLLSGENYKKQAKALIEMGDRCFVCKKVESSFTRMLETIIKNWRENAEFRELYRKREYICAEHCALLLQTAAKSGSLKGSERTEFCRDTRALAVNRLKLLRNDITHFCKMYDYRSRGSDWGNSRDSIERSISFLTAENLEQKI